MMAGARATMRDARALELERFRLDEKCQVLLVPMRTASGAAGLSLTVARFAFLLEPSSNVALEQQAISRLHRIGQVHEVTVFRTVVRNTIEEALARRRMVPDSCSLSITSARGGDDKGAFTLDELIAIFGISTSTQHGAAVRPVEASVKKGDSRRASGRASAGGP